MTSDAAAPLLPERLARAITMAGPMPIAYFMAAANAHYYATRDPLGAAGDFTTAPEISQMFGELVGLWLADLWHRAGRPATVHYVELGPGRGTLASDARRAMRGAGLVPAIHFVETSPVLRAAQADRHPDAIWHDSIATLPDDAPLLIVANEFFDALPVRQIVRTGGDWRERLVACQDTLFLPIAGGTPVDGIVPAHLADAPPGSIIETSPESVELVRALAARLGVQGGTAAIVDYGYEGPAIGETLQAVRGHGYANPFDAPGDQDLTAHVDFGTLGAAARLAGCRVDGPVGQGEWLGRLGIDARAEALRRTSPDRGAEIIAAATRLTAPDAMGALFRVLAITAPDWPEPEGFA